MTGRTHLAISAAAVAGLLAVTQTASRTSIGTPYSSPADLNPSAPGPYAIAGLLLLGILAGLFPDLDAPDSELQHLPQRGARYIGRYIRGSGRKRSALGTLAQALVHLASLPFSLLLLGASTALRAFTGHRGFTHTLWGALTFTALAATVAMLLTGSVDWSVGVGGVWLLGYATHLAADACTPSGIPLFGRSSRLRPSKASRTPGRTPAPRAAPLSSPAGTFGARAFHLLPERMLIRTGTTADTLLVRWVSWAEFLAASAALFLS